MLAPKPSFALLLLATLIFPACQRSAKVFPDTYTGKVPAIDDTLHGAANHQPWEGMIDFMQQALHACKLSPIDTLDQQAHIRFWFTYSLSEKYQLIDITNSSGRWLSNG